MSEPQAILGMAGVGFFGMLFIGFLAGWIAERTMNRDHGFLTNILVGIAGSFVGGTAASILGFQWYGFLGNLVVATIGAIAILWFFGKREHPPVRRGNAPGGSTRREKAEKNLEDMASDRPEETGSNLPPIYHATSDGSSGSAPKIPASGKKQATTKPAAKKSTAKRKK